MKNFLFGLLAVAVAIKLGLVTVVVNSDGTTSIKISLLSFLSGGIMEPLGGSSGSTGA